VRYQLLDDNAIDHGSQIISQFTPLARTKS
jgi:hypothetical protein